MSVAAFTRLTQGVDQNGLPILAARPQSNYINAKNFSAAGNATQAIPTDASGRLPNFVVIGGTQNVDIYVLFGGATAVPAADNTSGTAPEANPMVYQINGNTTIGLAVTAAANVTLAYYS
jgi:hypothetical protein